MLPSLANVYVLIPQSLGKLSDVAKGTLQT